MAYLYNKEVLARIRNLKNNGYREKNGRARINHYEMFGDEDNTHPLYFPNEDNYPYDNIDDVFEDIIIINDTLYLEVIDVKRLSLKGGYTSINLYFGILRSFANSNFSTTPAYWTNTKGTWSRVRFTGYDNEPKPVPKPEPVVKPEPMPDAFPIVEPKPDDEDNDPSNWGKAINWHQLKI